MVAGKSVEMKLNNGSFESSSDGTQMAKGTYTTSGNIYTQQTTHLYGDHLNTIDGISGLESKWYTKADLKTADIFSDEELNENFKPHPFTYPVSGNTLTLTQEDSVITFTKKGSGIISATLRGTSWRDTDYDGMDYYLVLQFTTETECKLVDSTGSEL
ncbi:MAG: hypothetical protein LBB81_00660 [Treponema sp.]|nr:hypothetical protein [Treponema sp.]